MPSPEVLTALEGLHRELERLEPAIKHVETAQEITRTVKLIPEKHIALIESLKADNDTYKESLSLLFSAKLSALSSETEKLILTTREIQSGIQAEQDSLKKLKEQIAGFHDKVERINFPERLDKLDATVSGIMSAVQATQSRLDNIERNLTDRISDLSKSQEKAFHLIGERMESKLNRVSIFQYIGFGVVVVLLIVLIFGKM
jgi:chromosome segregation ATPase